MKIRRYSFKMSISVEKPEQEWEEVLIIFSNRRKGRMRVRNERINKQLNSLIIKWETCMRTSVGKDDKSNHRMENQENC